MNPLLRFLLGLAINILFGAIFLAVETRLVAISNLSTDVLFIAPFLQGILIIVPTAWAWRAMARNRPLGIGP